MTPLKMTVKASGKVFYGMQDGFVIYTEIGVVNFHRQQEELDLFLQYNSAEEVEFDPKHHAFKLF